MRKILSSALCVLMTASLVAGCGNSAQSTTSPSPEATTQAAASKEATIYYPCPELKENLPEKKPSAGEDFYLYANYDEMKDLELPTGYSSYTSFSIIDKEVREKTISALKGNLSGDQILCSDYFKAYSDMDKRNNDGWKDVKSYIDKINAIETIEDYHTVMSNLDINIMSSIFSFVTDSDLKDSLNNSLYIMVPSLALKDSAEYKEKTELGKIYQSANDAYFKGLLSKYGYDEKEAKNISEAQYSFEEQMAQFIYPTEVKYREDYYDMIYNKLSKEELIDLFGDFPIEKYLDAQGISDQKFFIVDQPEYYKNLQNIVTEENLSKLKAYTIINILAKASSFTDQDSFTLWNDWNNACNGSSGMKSMDELAYDKVCAELKELTGMVYANKYFSDEDKESVEKIVQLIIDAFKTRFESADWMGEETKAKAIEKLDTMGVYIAYPEELFYDYSNLSYDQDKSLLENTLHIEKEFKKQILKKAGKPVNRATWAMMMAPNVVNACYNPPTNSIYFPASILSGSFYNRDASISANLGGIGCVIGHEITHAFDTTGSQFDKDGNMQNWWTAEDREAFTKLTQKVNDRYSSYAVVDDYHVNGQLCIGESVADLGGMAACLDIMKQLKEQNEAVNYEDFFLTNSRIWLRILTKENLLDRLKNDPHPPACLRGSLPSAQFQEFYDTFNIKEGDKMYTAPENRLKVW